MSGLQSDLNTVGLYMHTCTSGHQC